MDQPLYIIITFLALAVIFGVKMRAWYVEDHRALDEEAEKSETEDPA